MGDGQTADETHRAAAERSDPARYRCVGQIGATGRRSFRRFWQIEAAVEKGGVGLKTVIAVVLVIGVLSACTTSTPSVEATAACRVTTAADRTTDPPAAAVRILGGDSSLFGDGDLWVVLASGPAAEFDPETGLYHQKVPWYRGVEGPLEIEGRWLEGSGQLAAVDIPSGYGPQGMQPTGLYFPEPGCWQITGTLAGSSITFVMNVAEFAR